MKKTTGILLMIAVFSMTACSTKAPVGGPIETSPETIVETSVETVETATEIALEPLLEGVNMTAEEFKTLYTGNSEMIDYTNKFVGKPIQDFNVENSAGESLALTSIVAGKNIIVEFMGTWCPTCQEAKTTVENFNVSSEVKVVSIALNDTAEAVKAFKGEGVTEYYLPAEDNVIDLYGLQFVPIYFFVDTEGIIQLVYSGDISVDNLNDLSSKSFGLN